MIDPKLTGRTAIVTGANHGIGAAVSLMLAEHGANVVVTYLRLDPESINAASYPPAYGAARQADASAVVDAIKSVGGACLAVELDLRDAAAIGDMYSLARQSFGDVHILVNNASAWLADSFDPTEPDRFGRPSTVVNSGSWDYVFDVDARGSALMVSEFARYVVDSSCGWGRIVSITSGGMAGFPGEVSYGAAKAALESLTLSAASELNRYGVTANLIHPPAVDTGWISETVRASISGRILEPADVAQSVLLLVSSQAGFITRQSIYIS